MFKNFDKSETIYLYDTISGGYIQKFPSENDVLKFLASTSEIKLGNRFSCPYLEELNMSNDKLGIYNPFTYSYELVERRYFFIDELNRFRDFRLFINTIRYYYENEIWDYNCCWKRKSKRKLKPIIDYQYRYDPVPYHSHHRSRYFRTICRIMNECRNNSDVEAKSFVRAKRNVQHLKENWYYNDVRSKSGSHSWKDCTKKRKQWM